MKSQFAHSITKSLLPVPWWGVATLLNGTSQYVVANAIAGSRQFYGLQQ
jgi:hypothetical protein